MRFMCSTKGGNNPSMAFSRDKAYCMSKRLAKLLLLACGDSLYQVKKRMVHIKKDPKLRSVG